MPAGTGVAVPGLSPGATDPPGTAARRTPIRVRPPVPGPGRPTCSSGRTPRGPPARPSTERGADQGTVGRPSVERAHILGGPDQTPFSSPGRGQDGSQPDKPDEARGSGPTTGHAQSPDGPAPTDGATEATSSRGRMTSRARGGIGPPVLFLPEP